jgi:cell division protein ZapA
VDEVNRVQVNINGEIITLVSSENEEYVKQLAAYIDTKINEITNVSVQANIRPNLRNLLAALNIADELFKEQENTLAERQATEREIQKNERLQTLIDELRTALDQARAELSIFKESRAIQGILMPETLLQDTWTPAR